MPALILTFLTNNWKPLLVALLIAIVFSFGFYEGHIRTQAKYEAILAKERVEAATERENIHKEAHAQAVALEAELEKQRNESTKLAGSLKNEIKKHSVYTSCIVPSDGVRLFNDSISERSTGR